MIGYTEETKEIVKQNVLRMAAQHKEDCHDPECNVNLSMISVLIRMAGIEITNEEFSKLI